MMRFFHEHEHGATLTELVICIPMMMLCFGGIIHLGGIARELNVVEGNAYHAAMDKVIAEQRKGILSVSNMELGLTHAMPSAAAIHAMSQLESHPPRQRGAARHFLVVSEMANYSFGGIALSGHLGESYSRTRLPRLLGLTMAGVDNASTSAVRPLAQTSIFASQIIDDSPGQNYNHNREKARKPGFMRGVLDFLNTGLNASGGRAAFAAGVRYGTETGDYRTTVGFGPYSFQVKSHYTVTVAPHTSSLKEGGTPLGISGRALDQMRATAVIRMTMADHRHYNEIFGFTGLQDSTGGGGASVTERVGLIEGSHLVGDTRVIAPRVDQLGYVWPMDYGASLVGD